MRTRLLRAGFFHNEELAALPPHARLLFQGLWLLADREGRVKDQPAVIRASIFPYEEGVDVPALLDALARAGFIARYLGSEGRKCLVVVNFGAHQSPHHREPESKLPPPPKIAKFARKNQKPRQRPGKAAAEPRNGPPNTDPDTYTDPDTETGAAAEPRPIRGPAPTTDRQYRALASLALDRSLVEDRTDDPDHVLGRLRAFVRAGGSPFDEDLGVEAVEAARTARARKADELRALMRSRPLVRAMP